MSTDLNHVIQQKIELVRDRLESETAARDRRIASTYMTGGPKKYVAPLEGRVRLKYKRPSGMPAANEGA